MTTNIILHYSKSAEYNGDKFLKIIKSILNQTNQDFEITIINSTNSNSFLYISINSIQIKTKDITINIINNINSSTHDETSLNSVIYESISQYQMPQQNQH